MIEQRFLDICEGVLARRHAAPPSVHQSGFIQIPVESAAPHGGVVHGRVHVWPDSPLVKEEPPCTIHDHRFGFRSVVLLGEIENQIYTAGLSKTGFLVYECQDDNTKTLSAGPVGLTPLVNFRIRRGGAYSMQPRTIHETFWTKLSVTYIEKYREVIGKARVFVPSFTIPSTTFDRHRSNDPAKLWPIIDEAMLGVLGDNRA